MNSATTSTEATPQAESSRIVMRIDGMHCASCVGNVERALSGVPGVRRAQVNLATGQASVEYDGTRVGMDQVLKAVRAAGYDAELPKATLSEEAVAAEQAFDRELNRWWRRLVFGALLLGSLFIISYAELMTARDLLVPQFLFATALVGYVGWPFLWGAIRRLRHGSANMDTLVAIGSLTAYGYGTYEVFVHGLGLMRFFDAGMILVFITLGRYLEHKTRRRASTAIRKLMTLAPELALVRRNDQVASVHVDQVDVGETIIVRPGDRVAMDGEIVEGTSQVDESWLTGESTRVVRQPGDALLAGSINGNGALMVRVTRSHNESTLGRVVELVRRAQESKANVQRFADRVAAWFVPTVLLIALGTLFAWVYFAADWFTGMRCAVAVTVVSCPCAFGLATPTAIMAACQRAARLGILIKNAQALETASGITSMLFDKTGTITRGEPRVTKAIGMDGVAEPWLALAAAAEQSSSHPLATAIVAHAHELALDFPRVDRVQSHPGEGISGQWNGRELLVGNATLLRRHGIRDVGSQLASSEPMSGATRQTALVALGGRHVGTIAVETETDPHMRQIVKRLKRLGITSAMVTGDRQSAAAAVAESIGMDEVQSQASPGEKHERISRLRSAGHLVGMVGDGINDAPALAAADLGVAIGSGADVALESADIVLVKQDLRQLVTIIQLARLTMRTIKQNLLWAVIYNMLLIPFAAGVLIPATGIGVSPVWAAAAMAASSLTVVMNSLRLSRRQLLDGLPSAA